MATCERYQVLGSAHLARRQVARRRRRQPGPNPLPMLETVRHYALEKLGESGEADAVRRATAITTRRWLPLLDAPAASTTSSVSSRPKSRSTTCALRLRGAAKTRETAAGLDAGVVTAAALASAGPRSGKGWPGSTPSSRDEVAQDAEVAAAVRARALADKAVLDLRRALPTAWIGRSKPWRSRATSMTRPCWPGRSPPAARSPPTAPSWPGRTSPRRSASPGAGRPVEAEPDSGLAGRARRSPPVTRSRRARPPKKDATSPTRSATGSTRGRAAMPSAWPRYDRATWPEPSRNSAR